MLTDKINREEVQRTLETMVHSAVVNYTIIETYGGKYDVDSNNPYDVLREELEAAIKNLEEYRNHKHKWSKGEESKCLICGLGGVH
ncbi:MAG: hypothetical protein ACE5IC_10110 [Candidatus Brocadiales bacterium]